jgi:hypothetical protein
LDLPAPTGQKARVRKSLLLAGTAALLIGSASLVYAQLEGSDRGIPPIDSSSHFEVTGVVVDVGGKNANEARQEGWKIAQRLGLEAAVVQDRRPPGERGARAQRRRAQPDRQRHRGRGRADRARRATSRGWACCSIAPAPARCWASAASSALGAAAGDPGDAHRLDRYALEFRTPGKCLGAVPHLAKPDRLCPARSATASIPCCSTRRRWAGAAAAGGAPARPIWRVRRSHRRGAAEARLPGGPAVGTFIARYGPDAEVIGSFELRADTPDQIPRMMAEGVQRMDALYVQAFNAGCCSPTRP